MPNDPRLSKPAFLAWLAATAVAAIPTWEEWRFRLRPDAFETRGCMRFGPWETSPLAPLRDDLDGIMANVEAWAVPALLVLTGFLACLAVGDPRRVGRRTAGVLVLIAVIKPATPAYTTPEACGGLIPLLSAEWFATVMSSWGSTQLCLLGAAALVLLTTWTMSPTAPERTAVAPSTGVTWRRLVALLVDYAIIIVVLAFVIRPALVMTGIGTHVHLDFGLSNRTALSPDNLELDRLLVLAGVFVYFWAQHTLWGRTPGKRLLRIRLVSAQTTGRPTAGKTALRTLFFPLLILEPRVGPLALLVDGLWALLDADGRTLHDRWGNTEVTRRYGASNAEPES
ncbi:RDD family protein [Nonomuraea muscovyensis]|uniref:RDD family protein n=1 Tax=Nonomuraea muscovyensis TaxID=1124761 RepID=UPI0034022AE1